MLGATLVAALSECRASRGKAFWYECSWKMGLEKVLLWEKAYRNDPNAGPIPCSHALSP